MAVLEIGLIVALSMATYTHIERPLRKAQWAAKHSITIGYGAIAVVRAAAFIQALVHPLSRFLYAGKPAQLAQAGVASLLNDRLSNGRVIWPAKDCVLTSDQDVGKTISWDRCTFGDEKTASRRFLVIGNSFSAAEFEMYSAVAEKGLGPVTVTSSWGASPAPGMVNRSAWSKANEYYWNDVVPLLVTSLRAGDVLVMINDLADLLSEGAQAGEEQKNSLNLLEAGLSNISEGMNHRGIAVVFQTSIPFMRDAQCTPDMAKRQWFNIGAPQICTFHTRVETLARRKPLDDVLQRVRKRNPNFAVLDLMPIMCAGKMCGMTNKGGSYLYRDEWSHPSVEANHLSRELFLSAVEVDVARGR